MLLFFFFKQKTAYEMRISDWSSDVCSSDLASTILCGLSADRRGISLAADLLKYRAAVAARNLTPFADAATSKEVPADLIDDLYELVAVSALLRSYIGGDGQELGRLGRLSLDAARQSLKKVDKIGRESCGAREGHSV